MFRFNYTIIPSCFIIGLVVILSAVSGQEYDGRYVGGTQPQTNSYGQNTFSSEGTYENFSRLTRPVEIADKLTTSQRPEIMKLIPKFDFQAKYIPGSGSGGMEMLRFGIGTKLGLPGPELTNFGLKRSFFMLSPNLDYTSIDWKPSTEFPDSLYNVGLNVSWIQPLNDRWMLMIGASPSWASDGKETKDSIRCQGMFGFTWTPNKEWKIVFGGAYLDRDDINFMPFGGAIWTPNEDWRLELMAPQARLAMRLRGMSDRNYDRWVYTGVGVEGGNWAIRSVDDRADFAMYREFSVIFGFENIKKDSRSWNLELGYVFGRRMEFDHDTQATFKPDDSLLLRFKFVF